MSLKDRIKTDINAALRAKETARLSSLRLLAAAIQRREVDERISLDDAQVLAVIEKLIKQSREAIAQFTQGGRPELADKETADIKVWQVYMPQPLTEAEVDALIEEAVVATGAASIKDMGKVMGSLKSKIQGRADMAQVSAKIKAKLGA
jgi:uncharacterized protein